MKDPIQFETNGLKVLAVRIAPDASDIKILGKDENYYKKGDLVYKTAQNVWGKGDHILPEGNWTLHAVTDSMTEEQAKVLVKFVGLPWCAHKDYESNKNWFKSALEAMPGLLRSHGIDINKKHVILIQQEKP